MVKKLENQIGSPLFDRNYKPPRLTEIGYEYVRIAKQMADTETAFEDYTTSISRLDTGSIKIGSNQSLSALVMPKYITRFVSKYPNIHLSITESKTDVLEKMLLNGDLDLVINCNEINTDLFEAYPLRKEHLIIALPKSFAINKELKEYCLSLCDIENGEHTKTGTKAVPLHAFQSVPFIHMPAGNDQRTRTDLIFGKNFLNPPILFEIDRLTTIYTLVSLGNAAAIVSDTVAIEMSKKHIASDDVVFYKIDSPLATRTISVLHKKNRYLSTAMKAFISNLSYLE